MADMEEGRIKLGGDYGLRQLIERLSACQWRRPFERTLRSTLCGPTRCRSCVRCLAVACRSDDSAQYVKVSLGQAGPRSM